MAIDRTEEYTPTKDEFTMDVSVNDRPAGATSTVVQSGWDAAETLSANSANYPTEFKFSDGEFTVIKFIDQNGPFAIYKQHFLQNKSGRKSYISLGPNDPLCTKLGSKPEDKRAFTIAVITPTSVVRQMLVATPRLYKTLHAAEFSPQGPLTKNFWAISRTGKMQQTVYNLNSIKPRDLMEDWGIDEAFANAEVAKIKPYDRSVIKENTWEELEEIANSLL